MDAGQGSDRAPGRGAIQVRSEAASMGIILQQAYECVRLPNIFHTKMGTQTTKRETSHYSSLLSSLRASINAHSMRKPD